MGISRDDQGLQISMVITDFPLPVHLKGGIWDYCGNFQLLELIRVKQVAIPCFYLPIWVLSTRALLFLQGAIVWAVRPPLLVSCKSVAPPSGGVGTCVVACDLCSSSVACYWHCTVSPTRAAAGGICHVLPIFMTDLNSQMVNLTWTISTIVIFQWRAKSC